MPIKHIIAQGVGFSPGSVKFVPTLGFSIGAAVAWTFKGMKRLFATINQPVPALEIGGFTDVGTVSFRLYDVTAAAPVAGSDLSTSSTSLVRLRTAALSLIDGNEYRPQFSLAGGATETFIFASILPRV